MPALRQAEQQFSVAVLQTRQPAVPGAIVVDQDEVGRRSERRGREGAGRKSAAG